MLRSFDARNFPPAAVAAAKRGRRISVCIPARDEEPTVGAVTRLIVGELMGDAGVVDELVVIDDGSRDGTARVAADAGARVVPAAGILPEYGTESGKGQAMWRALHVTTGDIVVYCDADVSSFDAGYVLGLVGPLLAHDDIGMVKAFYDRPLHGRPGEGGRVTELVARPLISLLFPHLAALIQPLAGECAARREVLEAVPFVGGYGVELGLLIDVTARFGESCLVQVDLGERVHRNRSLTELGAQSMAILQVALQRAGLTGAHAAGGLGSVVLPWTTALARPGEPVVPVTMLQRPAMDQVAAHRRSA